MSERSSGVSLTAEKLARVLMITDRRVHQLVKMGVLIKEGRGRYPLIPNIQAYIKFWQERAVGAREMGEAPDYRAEKARLIKAQADKAEMEAEQLRGRLLDAEIVEQEWGKVLSNLRQALLAIPSKIAQAVSNAKDAAEAEEIIRAQIYEALNELSAGQVSESD